MFKLAGITGIILVSCSGCATLLPDTVTPEVEHMSHLTQHEPFTNHPTAYGANIASVLLGWRIGRHLGVAVGEGINMNYRRPNSPWCGEIAGPREQFTARVTYTFEVKK